MNKYPYTNYQDVNLDWLISKASDINKAAKAAAYSAAEAKATADTLEPRIAAATEEATAEAKAAATNAANSAAAAEATANTLEPRIAAATEEATAEAKAAATNAANSAAAAEATANTLESRIAAATEEATAEAKAAATNAANSATEAKEAAASVPSLLSVLKAVYPVGAFYISASATSPRTVFGFGTWTQIKDRFILAAGDTYPAASSGGEATVTLTIDEIPAHTHGIKMSKNVGTYYSPPWGDGADEAFPTTVAQSAGGGQAHNNMPPYLTAYVWKRTA